MSDFDGETEFVESVARELRAPVVLTPALDERVMAIVRAVPHAAGRRRLWLLRPMTLRVSPLAGLLAAASVAGIAVLGASLLGDARRADAPVGVTATPSVGGAMPVLPAAYAGAQQVTFVFVAPAASNVSLVGEFNDWDTAATPLTAANGRGVWTVTLPLQPGRYLYMFVVDGTRWAPDPTAPAAPDDGFGVANSVVTVGGPAS